MYGIIYKVTNIANNKVYIGKTSKTLEERKQNHLKNRKYVYKRSHFYNAIDIYGEEVFLWEVIDSAEDETNLNKKEIFWIDFYKATDRDKGYNMTIGGTSGNTNITKSEEEKQIIYSKTARKKEKHHFYGVKRSKECRNKITESLISWHSSHKHPSLGKKRTENQKQKMSVSHIGLQTRGNNGKAKRVICIETGEIFACFKDAAEAIYGDAKYWYNINYSIGNRKAVKTFSWKEIEEEELK